MVTEKRKIIYSYRFGVPESSVDRKPEVIEQAGIWPPCLPEGRKIGDAFPGKSTIGPGAWDLDEAKCQCGKHILRCRKTYSRDLFSGPGSEYVQDVQVEVVEI